MTYLLDTCILSRVRKLKTHPEPKLLEWFKAHPETEYYVSSITIGEIERGIQKLSSKDHAKMTLEEWLHGQLIPQFGERILNFDKPCALRWGKLMADHEKKGHPLPPVDTQIAAIASHHQLILVTFNEKDFQNLDVEVINPLCLPISI